MTAPIPTLRAACDRSQARADARRQAAKDADSRRLLPRDALSVVAVILVAAAIAGVVWAIAVVIASGYQLDALIGAV